MRAYLDIGKQSMQTFETKFIIQQAALTHKLLRKVDSQLAVHGISFAEYMVLYCLNTAPQETMKRIDLAEAVDLSASGITRIIAPMHKIKLVEKRANPRDARVSLVKLSTHGKRILKEASDSFMHTAKTLTENLTNKQLKSLADLTALL
jgi:DNA-binding MarR family transcriptional regulator